ncbi:MAG: hypothetical protein R3190_07140 [Thermoanaerobaculia bacterium]|nr:hypothetical protein [Thermoanaerobaculia bacterium]
MITGQNSELRHDDVVFHVQTEDKGVDNPFIVSLIYVGGQVLAAKRTSYEEELAGGCDEKRIAELMDLQHRTMIAAIRHGKFDEMLEKFHSGNGSRPAAPSPAAAAPGTESGAARGQVAAAGDAEPATESAGDVIAEATSDDSLDAIVGSYLGAQTVETLALVREGDAPVAGGPFELRLLAKASPTGRPLAGASVRAELISALQAPQVLAEGTTDADGRLRVEFEIPPVQGGMAAVVVSVSSEVGDEEETLLL